MMKNYHLKLSLICVMILMLCPFSAYADIDTNNGRIDVNLNGSYLDFDVAPIMRNDRVMLPMRKIFESLGADVLWNENNSTVTATKDNTMVSIVVGSNIMYVNGTSVVLDSPIFIYDGRTMVPVRAISEAFGASVNWFGYGHDIVTISTYDFSCDDTINAAIQYEKNQGYYNSWKKYELIDITDVTYGAISKKVYRVSVNYDMETEDGDPLGYCHFFDVYTGELFFSVGP